MPRLLKFVDNQIKQLVEESGYSVHSVLINPDVFIWKKCFTHAELNVISQYRLKQLPGASTELQVCFNPHDKAWTSGKDVYQFSDSQKYDPIEEFSKKWKGDSIPRMSELLLYNDVLELNDYSKASLLHEL
ncbi:hypothetical protein BCV72DRAFT_309317 [Rhizopus microsporus var. microsporus]|uniref:Uncharacterized protein n=1 Tax=Rhizopus microsporus var. microsporus TaxID=86635 RepID=A0A1X0QR34_RHIZD|nr:hypothetical protein BCV72DRAFT_309317 [Rhizopus microsporus var. microsporus]